MAAGNLRRAIRQALTVARRDFIATVFTPTFLIFLLSPLFTIAFGAAGGFGASSMTQAAEQRSRLIMLAPGARADAVAAIDAQLRPIFGGGDAPPAVEVRAPEREPAAQARKLMASDSDIDAVLYGPLATPTILYGNHAFDEANYLATIADRILRDERAGVGDALSKPVMTKIAQTQVTATGHSAAATFAVIAIFFLTLFLAGLAVSTMAEERNNKVIEVLAAAVPLESVFVGKLIGMFGVALLFVGFWATLVTQITGLVPSVAAAVATIAPAIGKPIFMLLFLVYFVMSFLLVGATYLILGAQAGTPRELQLISLPMTFVQMAMVGLSTVAAGRPHSTVALIAEIFPFSSPMAMAAYAANDTALWPHAVAIVWQLAWVSLVIALGATWFRRGVLKSGAGPRRRRKTA